MPSSPLDVLQRPLQFALANLSAVKGLRSNLASVIAQVTDAHVANALSAELEKIDAPVDAERRASIQRVLAIVQGGVQTRDPQAAPPQRKNVKPIEVTGDLKAPLKSLGLRLNPRLVGALNKKGITRSGELLFLLPRVYEDRRRLRKIAQLSSGEKQTFIATVRRADETYGRGRKRQFRAVLADETGSIAAVFFQSGVWLKQKFPMGRRLVVSGEVRATNYGRRRRRVARALQPTGAGVPWLRAP